mgnify:CR=1 FL=1
MVLQKDKINIIKDIVKKAGSIALSFQKQSLEVNRKEDKSIVTQADVAVQTFLLDELAKSFPDAGFIYEENFDRTSNPIAEKDLTFIIDPIDGTAMFSMKMPVWCVSVGVFSNITPLYGFIYAPALDIFCYNDNDSAFYNNAIVKVRKNFKIDNETNIFSSSEIQKEYYASFKGKCRNLGSTALQSVLIINNEVNRTLAFIGDSCLWDWAGSLPIILKAGGNIRYLNGNEFNFDEIVQNNYWLPDHLIAYAIDDFDYMKNIFKKIPKEFM